MTRPSTRRVRAIVRKELREYRRHGSVVVAAAIFPLIFLIQPIVVVFLTTGTTAARLGGWHLLLYMLAIPVLTPAVFAAYSVAGERQQGSLEPVLATPIPREEFLLAKALAALIPAVAVAYAVYAVFLAAVLLFAQPDVAAAVLRPADIVAQVFLTPLLAAWSIWVGIAISTRSSDVRVAQQVSLLSDVPIVLVTSLIAFGVIDPTPGLVIGLTALLVVADVMGWRVVARLFDRERLITGTR
jgi:ABC-type transport system involved in multi-copper enzyme maturation permease subunit